MTDGGRDQGRRDRLVRNEALFREVNERVRDVGDRVAAETIDFLCECGDASCTEPISLTREDYEAVRSDPLLFAVKPRHEILEVETVIAERHGFIVVRKHENEGAIAKESDPRGD